MNGKNLFSDTGKDKALLVIVCIFFVSFIIYVAASNPPSVSLLNPANNNVSNTTNNITFRCNATDDGILRKLELYTNINGTFSLANSSCLGELCADSSTALLMHFNNESFAGENGTRVYDFSGNGNNATVVGATFNATGGKFGGAFEFGGTSSDYMAIEDSSSLDLSSAGSIELWLKMKYIYLFDSINILLKAPGNSQCDQITYALKLDRGSPELVLNYGSDLYTANAVLNTDTWYHIAAIWNGTNVMIYINGMLDSTTEQWSPVIPNNNKVWIGTTGDPSCLPPLYMNGSLDELEIYNRALTAQEISEHYNRTLTNNATKNFTISNIPDGTYQWNCKATDNESWASWAASNRTVYVDLKTPPQANSITLSPNSSDDIDPGVTIKVTANITDPSGVSAAILQYKGPSAGIFTNATMTYNSSSRLYNASFTPPIAENGVWIYRIWANDTAGSSGIINESNVSVEFDKSWTLSVINSTGNVSSDLGRTYSLKTTIAKMGTIVINNTGDTTLNFDLSATPSIVNAVYNVTEPFDLANGAAKHISINATAPETPYEYLVQITIDAMSAGAIPAQRIVNGTLISYVGGPQLAVSIENYAQTVQQSTTINLSAKVKNIGNETATNVWLNWTLPAGWTNTSGNLSQYIGNLASDAVGWNNIRAYIDPALANSNFSTIYAWASSSNNATGSDSKLAGVSCSNSDGVCGKGCSYATDSDCSAPSGDTGGSGGSGRSVLGDMTPEYAKKYALAIEAPKRIDAYRGQTARFNINASNAERGMSIENVTFLVNGYPQVLVLSEPKIIEMLTYGKKQQFNISMDVPNYTAYGEHNLEILVKGYWRKSSANASEISAKQPLLFVVHSATEDETVAALDGAAELMKSMNASNIRTAKIESLLNDARSSLTAWDYDRAKELAEKAIKEAGTALASSEALRKIKELLDEAQKYGVDAPQTSKMYALAKGAFERGDYGRAQERADNALLTASIEATGKVTVLRALHEYSWQILGGLVLAAFLASVFYRKLIERIIRRRLEFLQEEEKSLQKLIADAKIAYFEKRELTKSEYYKSMYDYETRATDIKRIRNSLTLRLVRITNPKNAALGFSKEEGRIKKLMEDTQRKYFERGEVSRTNYKSNMRELKSELAEIKMAVLSAGSAIKKSKSGLFAIALLCIMLPFSPASAAGSEIAAMDAIKNAEVHIKEMQDSGLGVSYANDTLNEAKLLFSQKNYLGAESLANYVEVIKKTATKIDGLIDDAEAKIYDASAEGLDVSEAQKTFDEGVGAFESEDYISAEKLLNDAINLADEARANAAMQKALTKSQGLGIAEFLKKNWPGMSVLLLIAIAGASPALKKHEALKAKKRMLELESKIKLAEKSIAELQKKYYEKGGMTKSEYDAGMKRYRDTAIKAKRELAVLKSRIEKEKSAAHKLLLKSS